MKAVVINANREGYGIDQISKTMTVGELIEMLRDYDEEMPVLVGNDRKSYGWYTYGGIKQWDVEEVGDNEEDDEFC